MRVSAHVLVCLWCNIDLKKPISCQGLFFSYPIIIDIIYLNSAVRQEIYDYLQSEEVMNDLNGSLNVIEDQDKYMTSQRLYFQYLYLR